jgi:hypothetical protein
MFVGGQTITTSLVKKMKMKMKQRRSMARRSQR